MQIQVQNANFSSSPCFTSEQQRLNSFSALQFVEIEDQVAYIISESQPSVENQDKLWIQVDAFGNPIGHFIYSSQYAQWVWPHPVAANDLRLQLYTGDPADVDDLDGGDSLAVTATTGPFWAIETDFTNLIPIGAGTVPVGTDAGKFATGSAYPFVRGIYFLSRTARQFLTP